MIIDNAHCNLERVHLSDVLCGLQTIRFNLWVESQSFHRFPVKANMRCSDKRTAKMCKKVQNFSRVTDL